MRSLWRSIMIILGSLILISALLLRVWLPSKSVQLAYEIDNLAKEKEALEEENTRLSIEIAKLMTPDRINRIATESLKMVRSPEAEIVILER